MMVRSSLSVALSGHKKASVSVSVYTSQVSSGSLARSLFQQELSADFSCRFFLLSPSFSFSFLIVIWVLSISYCILSFLFIVCLAVQHIIH